MKQDGICWDSSVLISWIRGDEIADKRRAIETVVNGVERGTQAGCFHPEFHPFDQELLRLNGKDEVENLMITPCNVPGISRSLF